MKFACLNAGGGTAGRQSVEDLGAQKLPPWGFSVERLMGFAKALSRDVEIIIRHARSRRHREFTSPLPEISDDHLPGDQ